MDKERLGIQSVEVGFALLDTLARASGPLMLK
ncbi:MAG: IclR family transcriptional regulator, partial [Acidovorax sp.]|nr:IclR family transcriptional regulator [Acidovorax sp.]